MRFAASPPDLSAPAKTPSDGRMRLARMIENDYRFIWRILRRLGVPADAIDDATQQIFLIAAERLDGIKPTSERSFLFGTALRIAQSIRRRTAREAATDETDLHPSTAPPADELSDQKRAREMLNEVLDSLPLETRTVFILFELEGLSSPEIAGIVGVPVGTVASRLRRGRDQFRAAVAVKQRGARQQGDRT